MLKTSCCSCSKDSIQSQGLIFLVKIWFGTQNIFDFFVDSRYNNFDQECSDGNVFDLKNVYNVYFCSLGKAELKDFKPF